MVMQPQPRTDFVPAQEFVVDNLDTLKVLADPLRIHILELMSDPCTVKEVAAELDIPPTKLYYHINQLEKHGLIVLVDTRIVSGIIEKHYQTAAKTIRVKKALLSPESGNSDASGMDLTVTSLWEDTLQNLRYSAAKGIIDLSSEDGLINPQTVNLRTSNLILTEEQAADFVRRFRSLVDEFYELTKEQSHQDELKSYKFFSILFPSARKRHPDSIDE